MPDKPTPPTPQILIDSSSSRITGVRVGDRVYRPGAHVTDTDEWAAALIAELECGGIPLAKRVAEIKRGNDLVRRHAAGTSGADLVADLERPIVDVIGAPSLDADRAFVLELAADARAAGWQSTAPAWQENKIGTIPASLAQMPPSLASLAQHPLGDPSFALPAGVESIKGWTTLDMRTGTIEHRTVPAASPTVAALRELAARLRTGRLPSGGYSDADIAATALEAAANELVRVKAALVEACEYTLGCMPSDESLQDSPLLSELQADRRRITALAELGK